MKPAKIVAASQGTGHSRWPQSLSLEVMATFNNTMEGLTRSIAEREGLPWSLEGLLSSQIKDQCQSTLAYDRGHMIPANHWDHDKSTIKQTNYMINIMPQMDKMNRGAWLETEMVGVCCDYACQSWFVY